VTSAVRAVSLASDSLDTVHSRLHARKEVEEVGKEREAGARIAAIRALHLPLHSRVLAQSPRPGARTR